MRKQNKNEFSLKNISEKLSLFLTSQTEFDKEKSEVKVVLWSCSPAAALQQWC